jgi:hypothetical protein
MPMAGANIREGATAEVLLPRIRRMRTSENAVPAKFAEIVLDQLRRIPLLGPSVNRDGSRRLVHSLTAAGVSSSARVSASTEVSAAEESFSVEVAFSVENPFPYPIVRCTI